MKLEYPQPGGRYKHYKGGIYEFLFMSSHTETNEVLVIYKSVLFGSYYARPLESWNELTDKGEKRFELINQ
jgi:hypothetical protein